MSDLIAGEIERALLANIEYAADGAMTGLICELVRREGCPRCHRRGEGVVCYARFKELGHEMTISHGLRNTACTIMLADIRGLFKVSAYGAEVRVSWSDATQAALTLGTTMQKLWSGRISGARD
jgi:hypothetical protein